MARPACRALGPLLAASLCLGASGLANADDGVGRSSALWDDAQSAEASAEPARAMDAYRRLVEAAPTSRLARKAEARLAYLEPRTRQDPAVFEELLRLQHQSVATRAQLEALRERATALPSGPLRTDVLAFVAETYLERLADPPAAVAVLDVLLSAPELADADRALALSRRAVALDRLGRRDESIASLRDAGLTARPEALWLERERLLERVGLAAWGTLAAFGVLVVALRRRGRSTTSPWARVRPAHVVAIAFVHGVPMLVARAYDPLDAPPFHGMAGAGLAVTLLVIAASSRTEPRHRGWLALGAGAAYLAAAFLALEHAGALMR